MTDATSFHATTLTRRRQDNPWLRRVLLVLTVVVLVDAVFGERGLAQTWKARRAYADARVELVQLRNTNAGLREQARRLSVDVATIEGVARQELGLMREGEVMFIVKPAR